MTENRLVQSNRSEEHTSELQSRPHVVCRLLLEKKNDRAAWDCVGAADRRGYSFPPITLHLPVTAENLRTVSFAVRCDRSSAHLNLFFFNDGAPPRFYPFAPHIAVPA